MADKKGSTGGNSARDGDQDRQHNLDVIQKIMAELLEMHEEHQRNTQDELPKSEATIEKFAEYAKTITDELDVFNWGSESASKEESKSEKIIFDPSMMTGNVSEKGAESSVSDSEGDGDNALDVLEIFTNIFEEFDNLYEMVTGSKTEKLKAVEEDINVKERATLIESYYDAKGSTIGEKVGAPLGAFKKSDEEEPEDSLAGVAELFKEADDEEES